MIRTNTKSQMDAKWPERRYQSPFHTCGYTARLEGDLDLILALLPYAASIMTEGASAMGRYKQIFKIFTA